VRLLNVTNVTRLALQQYVCKYLNFKSNDPPNKKDKFSNYSKFVYIVRFSVTVFCPTHGSCRLSGAQLCHPDLEFGLRHGFMYVCMWLLHKTLH
jgi:hypothetical protein